VADEKATEACAAAVEAEIGPVEVLVNSAGIIQVPVRPTELSMSSYDDVIRVDQRGTYVACVAFGRHMLARRRGAIINIASVAGMRSMPLHAYGPAKAAVIATTECLAAEWGPDNVRVNCIAPGLVKTEFARVLYEDPQRRAAREAATPLRRLGEPEDIAGVAVMLASRAGAFITGQTISVSGGLTMHG